MNRRLSVRWHWREFDRISRIENAESAQLVVLQGPNYSKLHQVIVIKYLGETLREVNGTNHCRTYHLSVPFVPTFWTIKIQIPRATSSLLFGDDLCTLPISK
jgi:hypothetical protein